MYRLVQYNSLNDFMHDVEEDSTDIYRNEIRLCTLKLPVRNFPLIQIFVVAAVVVEENILECRIYCGDRFTTPGDVDSERNQAVDKVQNDNTIRMTEFAERLDLDIRGGRYITVERDG